MQAATWTVIAWKCSVKEILRNYHWIKKFPKTRYKNNAYVSETFNKQNSKPFSITVFSTLHESFYYINNLYIMDECKFISCLHCCLHKEKFDIVHLLYKNNW